MVRKKTKEKVEETGGELTNIPNEKYRKFFAKFSEIETLDVEQWKIAHVLGYFCKKYKETYKVDYPWKFNNESPTKCFEVWQANTLSAKLSANPKILKEYIDWVYLTKVVQAKRRLTSISFMTHDAIVNDYKFNILLAGKKDLNVDRSTLLPSNYQIALEGAVGVNIRTYGDLAFVVQMDPLPSDISIALDKMKEMGFDDEVLKRIV